MELPTSVYTWKLNTTTEQAVSWESYGDYHQSPYFIMHGLKWHIKFFRNFKQNGNTQLIVYLKSLPNDVAKIEYARTIKVADTVYTAECAFDAGIMNHGWTKTTLMTKEIQDIKQFTFTVKMTLLSVFNKQNIEITGQYVKRLNLSQPEQKSTQSTDYEMRMNAVETQLSQVIETIAKIQNDLQDINLQIKEEQKSDNNNLKKQIDDIKKTVEMLSSNNKQSGDNDKQEFKIWVEQKLKLPQYYNVFVENGIETIKVVQLMTKEELTEMGITKIGHKMQILEEIQKLKHAQPQQEGGTAYH